MPIIQVEAEVSGPQLLKGAAQLEAAEFDQFVADVLRLRAQRQGPHVSEVEGDLLMRINQGLPPQLRQRLQELIGKRQQESLTADEHAELLRLTDEVEHLEANRLDALTQLAQLRGTTLADLMAHLHIPAPSHD
jgi:hypothetical protein